MDSESESDWGKESDEDGDYSDMPPLECGAGGEVSSAESDWGKDSSAEEEAKAEDDMSEDESDVEGAACTTSASVEILHSPLHGLGLFVKKGHTLQQHTVVSWYPGSYLPLDRHRTYEYGIDAGRIHGMRMVLDASRYDHTKHADPGLAHLANSCHPYLPGRQSFPNCVYRVRSEDKRPPMLVTVCPVAEGCELLSDYHWMLPELGVCTCDQCDYFS